jgi:hypothetical protein
LNYLKANFLEIPAMTDWKALCAELADRLDDALTYTVQSDTERSMRQLITRTRAELAQPEPEGLTNQEIEQWADATPDVPREALDPDSACWHRSFSSEKFCDTIRSALEHWCVTPQAECPAIEPVLVRERPPGPKDCDSEGRCWWLDRPSKNGPAAWILRRPDDGLLIPFLAWLPHYALPVPTSQEIP